MVTVRPRRPAARWAIVLALVGLLMPAGTAAGAPGPAAHAPVGVGARALAVPGSMGPVTTSPPTNVTLTVNTSSVNLSNQFWGTTINNEVRMFRGETDAVNATPARVLVWPGAMAGEDYDPFTNTHYNTYNGTGTRALTSEAEFVSMCKAIRCIAIVQVPAEIDNASFAEKIVNYTERNLSFVPAYWMIGNEPELWGHWKVPWKHWNSQYTTGPTPTQFANEVLAYVSAIRNVDNTTPILGLPASGCTCGYWTFAQWIAGVLKVTGNKIQAVAFHEYPAGWLGTGDGSLLDFYQTLQSAAAIPPRMVAARAAVTSTCSTCNVSVFISELGAALSWSAYGQYAIGFSGPLSIASQLTQAMDDNLTNVDLFAAELATTNSWFNPQGYPRADYALYTQILDHLGTRSYSVNVSGLSRTLYGIATVAPDDHGRRDLLVMNDNISHSISFAPQFAGAGGAAPVEAWGWNGSIHVTHSNSTTWVEPYTPNPVPALFPDGLPSSYTLPPQSLVLFESYPSGGTYVRVQANNAPAGTPWYVRVGSGFHTTTAGNLSLLLAPGSYPVGSVPILLPVGGKELVPAERLGPVANSPATVAGNYTNLSVSYVDQFRVNVTSQPVEGGTITPGDVGWWNASEPLRIGATPAPGYAFVGWSGWGPGSYNGTNRTAVITPTGRVFEKARFVVGDQVDFQELGLPDGTPWSVTVRGYSTPSLGTDLVTVWEPNGTFGFQVSPVPGYRSVPRNGSFLTDGPWRSVVVRFIPITPPGALYAVGFHFEGLPVASTVSITIRGATLTTTAADPIFPLLNGSYAYRIGYVAGYHVAARLQTFEVNGSAMTVEIPFVPTVYPATWAAYGARFGMNWSLEVNGSWISASSAWVSTSLTNGSYPFRVRVPSNFTVSPRSGVLVVNGSAARLDLVIGLQEFPTGFEASGPGSLEPWSVRLGNLTQGSSANRSTFLAANGSYSFDVHPPAGYYAVPSHGRLTVAGAVPPTEVRFYPTSERPSAALVAHLSSVALAVSFWIGVSIFAGFASVRWIRRRGG